MVHLSEVLKRVQLNEHTHTLGSGVTMSSLYTGSNANICSQKREVESCIYSHYYS